jgi:hypothetical protein
MRSDDVFAAGKNIGNRFLLCRVASVSARHLQEGPKQFTESINKSFKLIASMSTPQDKNGAAGAPDHVWLPLVNSAKDALRPPLDPKPRFALPMENAPAR